MAATSKKITENPIVLRIVGLLQEQGKNDKDLTDFLGLPPGSMAKWKYENSTVYLKYIPQISEYLQTTPNYLFLGTEESDNINQLTPMEKEVLRMFRSVDISRRRCIRDTLKFFLNSNF